MIVLDPYLVKQYTPTYYCVVVLDRRMRFMCSSLFSECAILENDRVMIPYYLVKQTIMCLVSLDFILCLLFSKSKTLTLKMSQIKT